MNPISPKYLFFVATFITNMIFAQSNTTDTKKYLLSNQSATGTTFQIGYSAGVHDGVVSAIDAEVTLDQKNQILAGDFKIDIANMSTGNKTRDCHMREALGIDYSVSQFPNEHVCNSDDKTPTEGPDAIKYPEISFHFSSVKSNSNSVLSEVLEVGKVYNLAVQGKFSVHGQIKDFTALDSTEFIPVQVKLINAETGELQLTGKFDIVLKDFGVIVKPFKFGFIKIGVADKAKVSLNMKLSPRK